MFNFGTQYFYVKQRKFEEEVTVIPIKKIVFKSAKRQILNIAFLKSKKQPRSLQTTRWRTKKDV